MFKTKHIDVDNAAEMALVKKHKIHPDNNIMFRLECKIKTCKNQVWPSQMYDVRNLPTSIKGNVSFACDGCVEKWIRMPDIPFTIEDLLTAQGAKQTEIKKWKDKNEAAKPKHTYIKEENLK